MWSVCSTYNAGTVYVAWVLMKKILVTGVDGLLGWHASTRIHSSNCAAKFQGKVEPFKLVCVDRRKFTDSDFMSAELADTDVVLHFAGVNRGADDEVREGNPLIAKSLVSAYVSGRSMAHVVYANSIQSDKRSLYGDSKREAFGLLASACSGVTNLVLPHIFGECARPFYNNVTATLIRQILDGIQPEINPDGRVHLLHAGEAADQAIACGLDSVDGEVRPESFSITVPDLYGKIKYFHKSYEENIFPNIDSAFDLNLFNSYRAGSYPDMWPRSLKVNSDIRGELFEMNKSHGGQIFMSTTLPGVTRGNHFHLGKVERFLVLQGDAVIRIRKVLSQDVVEFAVKGSVPQAVDMPTLHTHSIENVGSTPLVTAFWTHDFFDPNNPDTFAEPVIQ